MSFRCNSHILMYHHVVPSGQVGALNPFAVSHQQFSLQMDWLQQAGFRTISLEQLFDAGEGKGNNASRGKPVVITFDDCPADLLDYAVPELIRRGMTATFFAIAGKIGGRNDWDAEQGAPEVRLMSGENLRCLADSGFEIGSHGMSHLHLRTASPEQINRELCDSRLTLEKITGKPVHFLAYPFGEYPEGYTHYCQEAGYRGAASIFSSARTVTDDPYCMRRILVHEGDRHFRFRIKLSKVYLKLRHLVDKRVIGLEAR